MALPLALHSATGRPVPVEVPVRTECITLLHDPLTITITLLEPTTDMRDLFFIFLLAIPVVVSTVSAKRGISVAVSPTNALFFCDDWAVAKRTASWFYSWGLLPANVSCDGGPDLFPFEPMFWGSKSVHNDSSLFISPLTTALLGFNEPNGKDQSNLTPTEAAALWPIVSAAALTHNITTLVAPVPSGTDTIWLDSFFAACNCEKDIRVIALHPYDCNAAGLKASLDKWAKYNKPLWVSEFNCGDGAKNATAAEHLAYMKIALPILDADVRVERYAWMSARDYKVPGAALFQGPGGTLTALGQLYLQ